MNHQVSKVKAADVSYELHSLGWKAFQDLCVSITSEVLGQTVQSFLPTRDGGRDGAFHGMWHPRPGEVIEGAFTVQCKFSSNPGKQLRPGDLADEVTKAKRLVERGLATNYLLLTNASLSGVAEEEIREQFTKFAGVKTFVAFGAEWICQKIRENPKLRVLVPRVYGLGDLSQILDERSYAQAREILSAMGDDLAKFVITDAFNRSATALLNHGFVLLLGEPACGKSTIAAALALGALDLWGCSTLKIRDSHEFVAHWNPHEPRQFFWVDDAFGATQFDRTLADDWNRTFSHLQSAIRHGARVLFTSRDYIYRAARRNLKEGAFPLMMESQVVINVSMLTKVEKEQILYNHLKLGNQPLAFRKAIKPFLPSVARNTNFMPEIARRLADPLFTRNLVLSEAGIKDFVEHPLAFLLGVLRGLDDGARAAIALVFMRGGSITSPIAPTLDEVHVLERLGGSSSSIREALNAMEGSLVKLTLEDNGRVWRFKHPTIRDAFASLTADDPELLDMYLAGTPPERMVEEISCGPSDIEGIKVVVPFERYPKVEQRLRGLQQKRQLHRFLTYRADKRFLEVFIAQNPSVFEDLRHWGAYMSAHSEVRLLCKMQECGLLPEQERQLFVEGLFEILQFTLDDSFLTDETLRRMLKPDEFQDAMRLLGHYIQNELEEEINETESNYSPNDGDSPEEHFEGLTSTLKTLKVHFKHSPSVLRAINEGLADIEWRIDCMDESEEESPEQEYEGHTVGRLSEGAADRSVFDDVDAGDPSP